jgi:hypothetical protein
MSDTPRTDEMIEMYFHARGTMLAKLSQQLERELNMAVEALQSIHGYWDRDEDEKEMPMKDACWHAVGTAYRALAKLKQHNHLK